MIKAWNYLMMMTIVSGCAHPHLEFKEDPLTGHFNCRTKYNALEAEKNAHEGEVILKYSRGDPLNAAPGIKGVLKITHRGTRDYTINPDEELTLHIDEIPYSLEVANSIKIPQKEIESYPVTLPSGRWISIGITKEMTKRQIAFFLPQDLLLKLSTAKTARFVIISSQNLDGAYPIILKFNPENIRLVEQFKNKCIKS